MLAMETSMKKQSELTSEEHAVVIALMMERLQDAGKPAYASDGETAGEVEPLTAGKILQSIGGKPWGSWDGGNRWYRLIDMETNVEEGDKGWDIILNDDGLPIGSDASGPVILFRERIRGHIVAITFNTGWNLISEVNWRDVE
jgi:hypothetical protein